MGVGLSCVSRFNELDKSRRNIRQVLPFVAPLTFFFLLPKSSAFLTAFSSPELSASSTFPSSYAPLRTTDEDGEEEESLQSAAPIHKALNMQDKIELVKPLLLKYMLPLCE